MILMEFLVVLGCLLLGTRFGGMGLGLISGIGLFLLTFVFGLMSRKIMRLAKKRNVKYSFLFVQPDGAQLAEIGKLLDAQQIRPVIDRVFPFEDAKGALEYLAQGRSKGKVVIKM